MHLLCNNARSQSQFAARAASTKVGFCEASVYADLLSLHQGGTAGSYKGRLKPANKDETANKAYCTDYIQLIKSFAFMQCLTHLLVAIAAQLGDRAAEKTPKKFLDSWVSTIYYDGVAGISASYIYHIAA